MKKFNREHKIYIPYDGTVIRYPKKQVDIFVLDSKIGEAKVIKKGKEYIAVSTLSADFYCPTLEAAGDWISREGDIINEFIITKFFLYE